MRQYVSHEPARRWRTGFDRYIEIDRVLIMGVVNATPDSFSDGGRYNTAAAAAARAKELVRSGADIIDIGAQSTRPGFTVIGPDEELERIKAVLPGVADALPRGFPISIDTFYPDVMRWALEHGACMINDVSGLSNPDMRMLAAETGCGVILMHFAYIAGISRPSLCTAAIRSFFERRMEQCITEEIDPEQIVLDPGIGFGKTRAQEKYILGHMSECRVFGRPLLAAASRKRVIREYYTDAAAPGEQELDEATFAAHSEAVLSGAQLVRVHSVL